MESLGILEENSVLVAGVVYALMNQSYHVSRNVRTQWFFKHLNKKISLPWQQNGQENEIDILSIYPQERPPDWGPETSASYQYLITTSTNVVYLSKINKAVYCLDMSPSISAVDIQHGQVMLDEIVSALKNSIEGVVKHFVVPGTNFIFEPQLFVTVIVHTPFFITPAQQVLVQGWRVTLSNVEEFLSAIVKQLELLEDTIADVSGIVHDEIEGLRIKQAESERLIGGLFEEVQDKQVTGSCNISMVGPDSGFINLLRYGMLALRLLPQCNLSNLVVITDGMITLPDIHVLDSVLTQLRSNGVAVSFLHVGSQFHPHSCHGLVPYLELMQFIASATLGAYIHFSPEVVTSEGFNIYQEAFISWSFRKKNTIQDLVAATSNNAIWNISNQSFFHNSETQLLTKKQNEDHLIASLTSVLCCRLHEGYIIKNVSLRDNDLEVSMILPWSNHIFIEYNISSEWPICNFKNLVRFTLSIKAPYEFLHDITCLMKKPFHSPYRQAVVSRFWGTLKTLSHTDILLSHLDSFSENPVAYTVPESIRSGMPLFYLSSNVSPPELSSSGSSCPQFGQFWRPVVLLEPGVWQKWLHTHRLGLILQPDRPLPHLLHTISTTSRSYVLQCRQAEATLFSTLKKMTTFVLVENHSYIKILPSTDGEKGPTWFYIVRVTSKPPCAVLHIAFLGGTPGSVRHEVVEAIREEMSSLRIPQRVESLRKYELLTLENPMRSDVECCTLIQKPLEKILIRYGRMPGEFETVIFPDGTQPVCASKPLRPISTLITTLSRYLHHKRLIWDARTPSDSHNNLLPTMLTTLTRMRLQEGFRFAHCTAGIINMVLEVQMKCFDEDELLENYGRFQTCIIQYILFPPHMTSASTKGSNSGDEMTEESELELRTELITECWIEPQHGVVTNSPPNRSYMENLHYHQIAEMMWRVDAECISNLLTFDHLQLMCHNQQVIPPVALDPSALHQNPLENWPHAVAIEDERIHHIPFAYNLMNLLPKCQQAEHLSSLFIQELYDDWECKNRCDAPNNLLMENLLGQLRELHHRELALSEHESSQLLALIANRPRDCQTHPIPFPTETTKVERKVSDTESTDTGETVPPTREWMISWAMYSTEFSSPSPGSSDDVKLSKKTSKVSNLLKKPKSHVPKWRCFVKSMASTHCVLTFIPASFYDLKMLMLGSEQKIYKPSETMGTEESRTDRLVYESNLNPDAEPFHPRNPPSADIVQKSKYSSSSILDINYSEEDLVFYTVPIKETTKDIIEESFRMRSSSWGPMKKQSEASKMDPKRTRTSSVGAKMKSWNTSKNHEYTNSLSSSYKGKSFPGLLTLPIYIYDCPLSNLVDALILRSSFERKSDIYLDKTNKSEKDLQIGNVSLGTSEGSTPDELDLHHHCKVVMQAFNKSYVIALFKSLHLNHKISSYDIQMAVDECEETLLEIDITRFIQTICGHYQSILDKTYEQNELSSIFQTNCISQEMAPLHKLIKQRFLEILTVCFKAVPSAPEYYFCCPPMQVPKLVDIPEVVNQSSEENQEFDSVQSDVVEFSSTQNSDDTRNSLLSNMDSESVSDYIYDVNDDLFPLFIHLVCTIRSQNKDFMHSNPVNMIPTCIDELFKNKSSECESLDFSKATVTLDIYCLTLPASYPADLPIQDSNNYQSPMETRGASSHCENMSHLNEHNNSSVGLKMCDRLQHLPFQQHKAINICIKEIKWFLNDEVAVFLLDNVPVSESTLDFVSNHVENSPGRHSCIMNTVGLDFVFGIQHSIEQFKEEFSRMKVSDYKIEKEGEFYFVIKDRNSTEALNNQLSFCSYSEQSFGEESSEENGSDLRNGRDWDFLTKSSYLNVTNKWLNELNRSRAIMPNFWLILKVDEEHVTSYFHCRFLEINCEEVQLYKNSHGQILEKIEEVCKKVNQTLLLNSLHETRMCDPLLEPETSEDIWKPNQLIRTNEDSVEFDFRGTYSEIVQKYKPGWFSCPVVWQTHFLLHPRLKTGPGKPGLSRATQALRTVLNRFSVNNRANMFVYQDNTRNNVFYLRLYENIRYSSKSNGFEEDSSPSSVSRSSSINSLTYKKPHEDLLSREIRPRLKSFGDHMENAQQKQEDFLTLKVHGITAAGMEVKNELVQVLQNRLDDAILEVVSVMLARNPMCKLSQEDVYFIQKPYSKPDSIIQLTVPQFTYHCLGALHFYLKQNLLQFLFVPKYIDYRFPFQDYSYPEDSSKRFSESNIFLYNQSPVSGSKGIACLATGFVDRSGKTVPDKNMSDILMEDIFQENFDEMSFLAATESEVFETSENQSHQILLEVRIWKQGRVNMEYLMNKLRSSIKYSLWDLITELVLLKTQFIEMPTNSSDQPPVLNKIYQLVLPEWIRFGCELNVPAVKTHSVILTSRHAVSVTLKEINNLVSTQENFTYMFSENSETDEAVIVQWDIDIPITTNYILISGSILEWKTSLETVTTTVDSDQKNMKLNQKFSSLVTTLTDGADLIIPRQTLLICRIKNYEVALFMYNWSKDRIEHITKLLTQLGHWLSARSNFLTGIISQKLGLFHNQPFMRKNASQLSWPECGELDSLLSFSPSTVRKPACPGGSVASTHQILRDVDPTPLPAKMNTNDPVVENVNQLLFTKSCDKKEQLKKLRIMWQSRVATPYIPLSEDTLNIFLRSSRIIHYCLTPLLFLPKWRLNSAAARDQSLLVNPSTQLQECSRKRSARWHQQLSLVFLYEYKQYLQTLGFIPVQITPTTPHKTFSSQDKIYLSDVVKHYLQKSLLGGILMLEISLSEPFCEVKLHALEYSRLQAKSSNCLIPQIIFKFLDECDKMKVLMHLHSFTYDFHLRCIHSYVSNQQSYLESDYHITSFLDDFINYYPKAPNFSRNLAYSGSSLVTDLSTPASQLYNFLLGHAKDYDMDVLRMLPNESSYEIDCLSEEWEFVLTKVGFAQSQLSKEIQEMRQIHDLDMTLIIAYDKTSKHNNMKFNFYIVLTSNKDLYPKLQMEWKLGKFRTVSTMTSLNAQLKSKNAEVLYSIETEVPFQKNSPDVSQHSDHLEIRQESVNYLGYYSSHEQLMHQIILEEASTAKKLIESMIRKSSVDCRVHILWNKLLSNSATNYLTYTELFELTDLASVQKLLELDTRLKPLFNQPLSFYQGLMKVLMAKYNEKCKIFSSTDNNVQHLLILHPRFLDGFVMLTLDVANNSGDLNVIFRQPPTTKCDVLADDIHKLIEGVVNACCFHLWISLVT